MSQKPKLLVIDDDADLVASVTERFGIGFSDEDFKGHYGHGPEAFLRKPFEPTILLEMVNRLRKPRDHGRPSSLQKT